MAEITAVRLIVRLSVGAHIETHNNSLHLPYIGYNYTFVECDEHLFLVSPRTLPLGIKYNTGSDWFTLSKEFVEYIIHQQEQSPLKELLNMQH